MSEKNFLAVTKIYISIYTVNRLVTYIAVVSKLIHEIIPSIVLRQF